MDEASPGTPAAGSVPEDRLDSWKEIAAYLKRDVTTVQRWEKREGMPVRRHVHEKLGSVYAFRSELNAWSRSRSLSGMLEVGAATGWSSDAAESRAPSVVPTTAVRHGVGAAALSLAAAVLVAMAAVVWRLDRIDYFWRNPLDNATFQNVTDFGGTEEGAAISRDGRFVAFLSDRDGQKDVWVTQLGGSQIYNLTRGRFQGLGNPALRMLGFSPDGALVTFWARGHTGSDAAQISVWAVPTLGGQARPYLEGAAEFDASPDGARLVYHTPGTGDPTSVKDAAPGARGRQIFAAAAGLHTHFPLWSPNGAFIYFVEGSLDNAAWDIWRMKPDGGAAERVTHHDTVVSYPVFLSDRTLVYLARDKDGSGPWLYGLDVEHRVPHRLGSTLERYTSLAASADGRRLVATLAKPTGTLWRLPITEAPAGVETAAPIALTTGRGFSPRLGPDYMLYVSSNGTSDRIWKLAEGATTELWSEPDARIIGGPDISPDGRRVAFSVARREKMLLYAVNADGTNARVVTEALRLRGAPTWAPDGGSIVSAADAGGTPHVFSISLSGAHTSLVQEYALDPVWSPRGDFLMYSGADVGTAFPLKALATGAKPFAIPTLTLTRGARRVRFFQGRRAVVVLRGDIEHKNLWVIDLETGAERQFTSLSRDFQVRDFDVSADGLEIVLEREQEHSDVVLIDLARRH